MVYFRIILLSLCLHLLFLWVLSVLPPPHKEDKTEVDVVYNEPKKNPKMVVRETNLPNEANKPNENPRFFSENTKNVKEETRAQLSGLTQNRGGGRSQQPPTTKPQAPPKPGEGNQVKPQVISSQLSPGKPLALPGPSVVGEKLPDNIKVGQWTALNTERYLFYTFFARVEERVRFRWETNVRSVAEQTDPRKISKQEWVTDLEVVLNKDGYFESATIRKACGLPSLDLAASQAFQAGAPFLNPPKEMVQDDGKIRLRYMISVIWAPQANL